MRPRAALPLAIALASVGPAPATAEVPKEQWRVEAFTDVLSGGPETGPAIQARGEVHTQCSDKQGNVYLASGLFIDIITREGQRYHLAGTGYPGSRDGPAHRAEFRLGSGGGYGFHNVACTPEGQVFVADVANRLVRRVFRSSAGWRVETWAGGGKERLGPGGTTKPRAAAFSSSFAVVALPNGEVLVGDRAGYYRISADGSEIRFDRQWPEHLAPPGRKATNLNVVTGDVDTRGNAYFLTRSPDVVLQVGPDGGTEHLAGIVRHKAPKPYEIGDGPPREIFLDATSSLAAARDGSAVFVCGGDEYDIRRIPTDGITQSATLMQNGRWYRASVHPNRSRGAAIYLPRAEGAMQPEGPLSIMRVSPLTGRDEAGNLYGKLNHWSGITQYVQGEGLLPTRVFRIRRVNGAGI